MDIATEKKDTEKDIHNTVLSSCFCIHNVGFSKSEPGTFGFNFLSAKTVIFIIFYKVSDWG